jgi:integrase
VRSPRQLPCGDFADFEDVPTGGSAFVAPAQQRLTVDNLLDSLQADYELRGVWNKRVESTVKKVHAISGPWRAVTVTSEAVNDWQLQLRSEGYRDATINRFCQILGQSFNQAIERRHLPNGPVIKHLSEIGNERKGFFTEAEILSLVANLPDYLKDFVLFGYITGMRKGEIQSLRWRDVYGDQSTLRPENSKNGEARTIPLVGELAELLERRKAARPVKNKKGETTMISEHVFHRKGAPIASIRKAWSTACTFANVPGRLFHDLRRCAARTLLAAGIPQAIAMKITGHKTDSMFRRYAIVTVEQQREAEVRSSGPSLTRTRLTSSSSPSCRRHTITLIDFCFSKRKLDVLT